jgi:AraC-like DNA-binding protein
MTVEFDTAGVDAGERFDRWAEASAQLFVPLRFCAPPDQPFRGRIRGAALGPIRLCEIAATAHTVQRTPRLVRAGGGEHFKLSLMLEGSALIVQDDREAVLRPGDFAIYDCDRPYTLHGADGYRMVVGLLPHEHFRLAPERVAQLTATRIPGDAGLAWALAPFLARLARMPAAAPEAGTDGVVRSSQVVGNVLDLIGALCESRLPADDPLRPSARRATALLHSARAYADAHLGDPALSPGMIAAAHYVSVRHLHTAFEPTGISVARWIRERRLERCRAELRDPAHAQETVATIAARWGLVDSSHFSRVFRQAYGMSPRDFRRG